MVHFEQLEEPVPHVEEKSERTDRIKEEFIAYVGTLLERAENLIGKGTLAEVYPLDSNPDVCVKIINDSEEFGTISPLRVGAPFYNSASLEAQFLSDLQPISGKVGIPKPYYSVEHLVADPKGKSAKVSALAMERLSAVSIDDVVTGREDLPPTFDGHTFWTELEKFITAMHERGIYHRDLHKGNIMIGKTDGRPFVIDFGTAAYATEYDAYERTTRRGNVVTPFIEDFAGLRTSRRRLEEHLVDINK
ncbi:MAG: phosphotransferase [bacterium]|nr:phosphotransferase [bacterium]